MAVRMIRWNDCSAEEKKRILRRSEEDISEIMPIVQEIVEDVRARGDQALCELTARFDFPGSRPENLWVDEREIRDSDHLVSAPVRDAISYAIENVRRFHEAQKPHESFVHVRPGIIAVERWSAIDSVALYVPRGRGSFPSMLYMLAVPAVIAGVSRIVVCTPPDANGSIDPACLYAAKLCGITHILRSGGAQAVAALALGTERIAKVDKIIGPGSRYVAAAKRLLSDAADMGLPAGPSESMLLADEHADPVLVALDLMIEAEHGADSSAILVTPSIDLAQKVKSELERRIPSVPGKRREYLETVFAGYGGIIITDTIGAALELVNEYAPEHLQIQSDDAWSLSAQIRHAGEILIGTRTPFSAANYTTGPNAVLPTGGKARTFGSVSVRDFMHPLSVIQVSDEGYRELSSHAVALADYEGFYTHAQAFRNRNESGNKPIDQSGAKA